MGHYPIPDSEKKQSASTSIKEVSRTVHLEQRDVSSEILVSSRTKLLEGVIDKRFFQTSDIVYYCDGCDIKSIAKDSNCIFAPTE